MKKALVLLLVLAAMMIPAFASGSGEQQVTTLTLSEVHAEGYPTTLADYEFARLVEEATDGRIKIEVFSGGTLYGEETGAIEALQIGDIAFARVSASPVASYVPALNIIQLPYLYRDGDHMWQVLNGPIGQDMLAQIQESGSGLVGLAYYDAGSRNFYTTKPVNSVADMKGLKIRLQNNAMMVEMVKAENNWPTYESMGDYQVAPYFVLDGHTRVPEVLLASEAVLESLDPADVEIIKECAKQTQAYEIEQWALREQSSEEKVVAEGVVVAELTPEQISEFQALMDPIYAEYGAGYEDLIQEIINTGL